jgi:MFS family permease
VSAPAPASLAWRTDALIVSLVSSGHLLSHFFQLLLAPLFPWLRAEFALSYAALGSIISVLFVCSAMAQTVAGFIVDRYGARVTLCGGLACLAVGALVCSASYGLGGMLLGAALVGFGNAVFHPVDFWLINHGVSEPRLGPAYSLHGVSGSLGWALAPLFMVGIASAAGWRVALIAAASLPLLLIALIVCYREILAPADVRVPRASGTHLGLAFLRLPAVWLCFAFFFFIALALGGVQSFAPTVFMQDYSLGRASAAASITCYMLASALGMLVGGWWVGRSRRLELNITLALALSVAAALMVASTLLPATFALAMMAAMGFGSGLSGPSRDMLIRAATPPGATGRVYGVVYSGLDAGIALGPVGFGKMIDHGFAAEIFFAIAACLLLSVVVGAQVINHTRRDVRTQPPQS